jgi:hypothetical protein
MENSASKPPFNILLEEFSDTRSQNSQLIPSKNNIAGDLGY